MKEFIIDAEGAGCRLDKQLLKILSNCGSGFVYKMLRKKNITLNDCKADGNEHLREGDSIKIFFSEETFERLSGGTRSVNIPSVSGLDIVPYIIYENNNIIIINKPSGLLSQKAAADDISLNEILLDYLKKKGELTDDKLAMFRPSVCNRLDRNTSGLVIFAKNYATSSAIATFLKDRELNKYYKCLVKGRIDQKKRIEGYLIKDKASNMVTVTEEHLEGSAHIVTEYSPVIYKDDLTLLEVKLITGKSHQIRAHLSSIGHPVLGDPKYGDRILNDILKKKYGIENQLLHSYRLIMPGKLPDILSGLEGMIFEAPLPEYFERLL